jgi:hypothetical protein
MGASSISLRLVILLSATASGQSNDPQHRANIATNTIRPETAFFICDFLYKKGIFPPNSNGQ